MTLAAGPMSPECDTPSNELKRDESVLIYAPIGRDAFLAAHALREQNLFVCICPTMDALAEALEHEVGVLLLAMDGLNTGFLQHVSARLRAQPPWSELPIILLASVDEPAAMENALSLFGNVTILQRPLRRASLLSAVQTGLRARQRQYQVRDLLVNAEKARLEAERQQAQIQLLNERLRRAMTETHHRVKNNLQVLAAMVDMQVMEDTDTLPVEEFQRLGSHIQMLASVHDLLTEQAKVDGQAHFVSSGLVMAKLLPLVQQLAGKPIAKTTIMEMPLSAKQGTSIALVLNELISNAFKHGNGYVEVSLTIAEHDSMLDGRQDGLQGSIEETIQEAILEVVDDGPGFPAGFDALQAAHTGLELVDNLCRWDLSGSVRYAMRPEGGGCVRVTLPLIRT